MRYTATNRQGPESTGGNLSPLVIVVRVSGFRGVDPIVEIENVMEREGSCWFGKLGKALGMFTYQRLSDRGKRPTLLALFANSKTTQSTRSNPSWYCVQQIVNWKRPVATKYPAYYGQFIGQISTWFLLVPLPKKFKIDLSKVVTISSQVPVEETLRNSMAGHLYCQLNGALPSLDVT